MQFFVDDSTKVTGKLQVGAIAKVAHRASGNDGIEVRLGAQPARAG